MHVKLPLLLSVHDFCHSQIACSLSQYAPIKILFALLSENESIRTLHYAKLVYS